LYLRLLLDTYSEYGPEFLLVLVTCYIYLWTHALQEVFAGLERSVDIRSPSEKYLYFIVHFIVEMNNILIYACIQRKSVWRYNRMVAAGWYDDVGQKHLRGFLHEILIEKRSGTVNLIRIMDEYAASNRHLRQSKTTGYQERRTHTKDAIGTLIVCINEHPAGSFTVGKTYRISAYQVGRKYAGIRVRDDKRQRKDFNFTPTSNSYLWNYFRLETTNKKQEEC
jgi:hypothetical protein